MPTVKPAQMVIRAANLIVLKGMSERMRYVGLAGPEKDVQAVLAAFEKEDE
jgi:hypothetical protein